MSYLLLLSFLIAADSTAPADSGGAAARADSVAVPGTAVSPSEPEVWLAREGDGRGQVLEPAGVVADAFGRVYVSDAALHRLQRFDPQGKWLGENGVLGSAAGEMRRPGSVVLIGVLGVGVLDRENRRVEAFDLFGKRMGTTLDLADVAMEEKTGRVDPAQLAADRGGALYVSDPARERVLAFDGSGQFLRVLGGFGSRPGQFRGLRGLATSPRGELVVTERRNARVQKLDADGRPIASWPLPLAKGSQGELPVAVDGSGNVAVADEATGSLWLFGPAGALLATRTQLGHPKALAFAPNGRLLVAGTGPGGVRALAIERAAAKP